MSSAGRLALVFATLGALAMAVGAGCSSTSPELAPDGARSTDGKDGSTSSTTSCANVGCAPPPPCGQACTEPCGCCPNYACSNDASADASDGDAGDAADGTSDVTTDGG